MDNQTTSEAGTEAKPEPAKPTTVKRLLSRKTGATLAELSEVTAWQPHSIRAYISGLRKKGSNILLEPRRDGNKAYRLTTAVEEPANG